VPKQTYLTNNFSEATVHQSIISNSSAGSIPQVILFLHHTYLTVGHKHNFSTKRMEYTKVIDIILGVYLDQNLLRLFYRNKKHHLFSGCGSCKNCEFQIFRLSMHFWLPSIFTHRGASGNKGQCV